MRLFKNAPKHWVIPTALAAVLVSALFISPAIGGPKFITGKKVNKTIVKKTNATALQIPGTKDPGTGSIDAADAVMGELPLNQGNYIITSTFTETRDNSGVVLTCELRAGNKLDRTTGFGGGGQIQVSGALSVAANVPAGGSAKLVCSDFSAANVTEVYDMEITALKVPKLTIK